MGDKVRIDDRWRIVIPQKYREGLKPRDELIISREGDRIILRKAGNKEILDMLRRVKLYIEEELRELDAEEGKHRYGGFKE